MPNKKPDNSSYSLRPFLYLAVIFSVLGILEFIEVNTQNKHREELSRSVLERKMSREKNIINAAFPELTRDSKTDSVVQTIEKDSSTLDSVAEDEFQDTINAPIPSGDTIFSAFIQAIRNDSAEIISKSPNQRARKDIVIRYYAKEKDEKRVYQLHELGFYIHERPSNGSTIYPSNVLHYGDSVTNEDLMLIAYTLIESGVQLQDISLSKFHDTWKAHSIEIGTDTTLFSRPIIKVADLESKWQAE